MTGWNSEVIESKSRSMCPRSHEPKCLVRIRTPRNSALLSPNHTPSAGRAPAGQSSKSLCEMSLPLLLASDCGVVKSVALQIYKNQAKSRKSAKMKISKFQTQKKSWWKNIFWSDFFLNLKYYIRAVQRAAAHRLTLIWPLLTRIECLNPWFLPSNAVFSQTASYVNGP